MQRRWSGRVGSVSVLTVSASAFLAGCGSDPVAYCVDQSNVVIADQFCDDDDPTYGWINSGKHKTKLKAGQKLKGGQLIAPKDSAGRSAAGLPANGALAGKSGKAGGFGGGGRSGGFGS
ncbi:hypothetical protein GCM10010123_23850 [Pilimelia anulata]|uniref:Lipoprotein n=1 Tax=Pilimelia anulata TaxID=53371 RepID=A0A8J3FAP7_9ACTN|nr:hypothetical protein [Pilimelia anulata]GGJ93230.1 hypothetical protein GCM10010123_23850 [Pilimelia anulata]